MSTIDLTKMETITRSAFFEMVWKHTMRDIGFACSRSDPLLHRLCKKWQIPTPTKKERGEMMRGRRVKRSLLPQLPDAEDPVVLTRSAVGFATVFPRGSKRPRKRPSKTDLFFQELQAKMDEEKRERDERFDGSRTEYLYKITTWRARFVFTIETPGGVSDNARLAERLGIFISAERVRPRPLKDPVLVEVIPIDDRREEIIRTSSAGFCDRAGVSLQLRIPKSTLPSVLELLGSGRLRYLKVGAFGNTNTRSDHVAYFVFMSDLSDEEEDD